MPFETAWRNPQQLLFTRLLGTVSLEDLHELVQVIDRLGEEVMQPPFHHVIDATGMDKFPLNVKDIREATRSDQKNVKVGWVIFVSQLNPALGFIVTTLSYFFNFKFRLVRTVEEALAFLADVDDRLNTEIINSVE